MKTDITKAFAHMEEAVKILAAARKESDARLVQEILLQLEQRMRLLQSHLGVLIGLGSHATVRTKRRV